MKERDSRSSKTFVKVATVDQVPAGAMLGVDVEGRQVVVCNVDGEFYAVRDECTHENYPLSEGELAGHRLTCMLHGACFDVKTGAVLAAPAYEPLQSFEVRVDGQDILIAAD